MNMWLHYDTWKLSNNEQACTCDRCESRVSRESDLFETTTGHYYCKPCADDYIVCKCCGKAIVHSDYDYDNTCDECVDDMEVNLSKLIHTTTNI